MFKTPIIGDRVLFLRRPGAEPEDAIVVDVLRDEMGAGRADHAVNLQITGKDGLNRSASAIPASGEDVADGASWSWPA